MLVEVHDEPELEIALQCGATLVGVNQRDLVTFEVDHERAVRMAGGDPRPASSRSPSPASAAATTPRARRRRLRRVLVGETLVTSATRRGRSSDGCAAVPGPARWRRHVREDLRHHQRGRRAAGGRDGRRRGRVRLRPVAAPDRRAAGRYDIARRLPPEILTVGVFRDEHPQRVVEIVQHVRPAGRAAPRHETAERTSPRSREPVRVGDQGVRRRVADARPTPTSTAPT